MASLIDTLRHALRAATPPPTALCVAFSGGPDSTALLHALAQLPAARALGLRAIHIDHALHADSAHWARHCATFCKSLDVPLTTVRVQVDDVAREGVEAAARRARYAAFAANLRAGESLVLAHHRDDQIETVLLKLLRGAGPEGLGGMRALRPFGAGTLWRPLLETPRKTICNYLTTNELSTINDPANGDPRFTRNWLRHELLPRIRQHNPAADGAILHAAQLCRVAADYIDDASTAACAALVRDDGTLDAAGWLALPAALRAPVLDAWLHARGHSAPPDAARAELERQVAHAARDRVPRVAWRGIEVRFWDGRLHAMPPLPEPPGDWRALWDGTPLALPPGCGSLTLAARDGMPAAGESKLTPPWVVTFRCGGERIRPAGSTHTRELRDLFQQAHMPPWLRARCPLIHAGDTLVAVADRWVSAQGQALFDHARAQPHWMGACQAESTTRA